MSYYDATIGKLSPAQISKLLNGHAARIMGGSVHKVKLSHEQAKKFHKAKMSGKAVQVRFDPYQIQMHRQLKGKGFFDDIGNAFKPMGSPQFWERAGKTAAGAAIDYAVPAGVGALAAGATGNPFAAPVASYGTSQLVLPQIHKAIGFGLKKKRGRPRKTQGGTVKQDLENFYNDKIPMDFHPGLESIGNAGIKMLGFGKRGRPRKQKGGSMFGMLSKGAKLAVKHAGPVVMKQLKPIVKQLANKVVDYGVQAAGPAAAAAVTAMGQPELAPFALMAANKLAKKSEGYAHRYIAGLGVRGRRPIRGSALMAAGY